MIYNFPIKYEEPIFRPPSESNSVLIQVTIGCSHNKCIYCAMYKTKKYKVRSLNEIKKDIFRLSMYFRKNGNKPEKIFLCDGDALAVPFNLMMEILDFIHEYFPNLRRVGIYATAKNIIEKSVEQLILLKKKKLNIAYIGIESGSDSVLKKIKKGNVAKDFILAAEKLKNAGWKQSLIVMLGIAGQELSLEHCNKTALVVSKMIPDYFSFLTTMPIPKTIFSKLVESGNITLLTTKMLLKEMELILKNIKISLPNQVIFRTNHVSNQFKIGGIIPNQLDNLLLIIKNWIIECPNNNYPKINSNYL